MEFLITFSPPTGLSIVMLMITSKQRVTSLVTLSRSCPYYLSTNECSDLIRLSVHYGLSCRHVNDYLLTASYKTANA